MIRLVLRLAGDSRGYAATQYALAGVGFALGLACLTALLGGDVLHPLFFGGPAMK